MSQIENNVCKKLQQRAELGLSKYGVSLADGKLSKLELLIHAQEEAMDLANYLEAAIVEEIERLEFIKRIETLDKELR